MISTGGKVCTWVDLQTNQMPLKKSLDFLSQIYIEILLFVSGGLTSV